MLPREEELIKMILQEFHNSNDTLKSLEQLREDIRRYVQAKVTQSPLPILNLIWEDITIDFIMSLPASRGYSNIVVKFKGESNHQCPPSLLTTNEFGPILSPYKIFGTPIIHKSGRDISKVLVPWNSLLEAQKSWDKLEDMKKSKVKYEENKGVLRKVWQIDLSATATWNLRLEPYEETHLGRKPQALT
ncbi:hypothetical protein V8G54_005879 [Vigna mungo]|uniref:Uncharacterized protein n=1 Tax=Vigna mungo TaxID=3915 RepID=A0AAQ3S5X4_VIGMU